MYQLKSLIKSISATALSAPSGWEDLNVQSVFASDLISDILVSEGEETLLLTSLLSEQVLRAASVIGAVAIVLVNRRQTPSALGEAAVKQGVPLFYTALPKFESCVRIGRMMESE